MFGLLSSAARASVDAVIAAKGALAVASAIVPIRSTSRRLSADLLTEFISNLSVLFA
jgi:hypothetical protein